AWTLIRSGALSGGSSRSVVGEVRSNAPVTWSPLQGQRWHLAGARAMLSVMVVVRSSVFGLAAAVSALLLLGSCGGADSNTLERCTPLDTQVSAPVELGHVVGIGRSEDGTLYLVDEQESDFRVFVSDGDVLQRYVVDGSGESTQRDGTSVSVTVSDLDLLLNITVDGAGSVRMGAYYGATDR